MRRIQRAGRTKSRDTRFMCRLTAAAFFRFPFLRRLFVEFAPAQLGENACLLTRPFETPQGGVEILVLAYANTRHRNPNLLIIKCFLSLRPGHGPGF